jgi:hypothetical protein
MPALFFWSEILAGIDAGLVLFGGPNIGRGDP